MDDKLTIFLKENRQQIVEYWLSESEFAPPAPSPEDGDISYEAIDALLVATISHLEDPENYIKVGRQFFEEMDRRFSCYPGHAACVELHRSGKVAIAESLRALAADIREFTLPELLEFENRIQESLCVVMQKEVHDCCDSCAKSFCPFTKDGAIEKRFGVN